MLKKMKVGFLACLIVVLALSVAAYAEAPTIIWTFNTDLEGWTVNQDVVELRVENGKAILKSVPGDPIFMSPKNLGINCADYKYIVLKVKTDSPKDYVDIYFETDLYPLGEATRVFHYIEPTTEEKEYVIDMRLMDTWDGILNYIRFDDDQVNGANTEIDYIAITNDPASVSKLNETMKPAPTGGQAASNPKTGDESLIGLAFLALASAMVLVFRKKIMGLKNT